MNHTTLGSNVLTRSRTFEERIDDSVLGKIELKQWSFWIFFFFAYKHIYILPRENDPYKFKSLHVYAT